MALADENTRSRRSDNRFWGGAQTGRQTRHREGRTANAAMTRALTNPSWPRPPEATHSEDQQAPRPRRKASVLLGLVFGTQRAAPRNAGMQTGRLTKTATAMRPL